MLHIQVCSALEQAVGALEAGVLPNQTSSTARSSAQTQEALQELEVRHISTSQTASNWSAYIANVDHCSHVYSPGTSTLTPSLDNV